MIPYTSAYFHTLAHFVSLQYKGLCLKVQIIVPFDFSFAKL